MLNTMPRRSLLLAAITAALATVPTTALSQFEASTDSDITVMVRNQNSLDVQIYAVTEAGDQFELGRVQRNSESALAIPVELLSSTEAFSLKIYTLSPAMPASLVDNRIAAVRTQPLSPRAGEEIRLMVRSPLANSFIDRGTESQR